MRFDGRLTGPDRCSSTVLSLPLQRQEGRTAAGGRLRAAELGFTEVLPGRKRSEFSFAIHSETPTSFFILRGILDKMDERVKREIDLHFLRDNEEMFVCDRGSK